MCNFHVDDLQGNCRYDMILGCNIFYELKIDLCLSNNNVKGNGFAYEGYNAPMKDALKTNFNFSSDWIKELFLTNISGISNICWIIHSVYVTS